MAAALSLLLSVSAMAQTSGALKSREPVKWLREAVIYQLQPRAFTPEGTLKAASARLESVRDLGCTVIYLCPVFAMDDDMDQSCWSPRQRKSGMNNPKNMYKMKDYFHVDPEYGTDDDLRDFVAEAHRLGMRVMFDLVYLHCGKNAVPARNIPGFVKAGQVSDWGFAAVDVNNPRVREYLYSNMAYYVADFNVDGYRCDVADGVPVDFWEECRDRLEVLNPEIGMLAESSRKVDVCKGFDSIYSFHWMFQGVTDTFDWGKANRLRKVWEEDHASFPEGTCFIRYSENHDTSNDDYYNRKEKRWGADACEAAIVLNFMIDGIPLLYNGQEVADTARHSIWGNLPVAWELGKTETGMRRRGLIRELADFRQANPALVYGSTQWLDVEYPESLASFVRTAPDGSCVTLLLNASKEKLVLKRKVAEGDAAISKGVTLRRSKIEMEPYSYLITR